MPGFTFGATPTTTAAAPATGSLFGTKPLFGTTTTTQATGTTGLFGTPAATTKGLFGSTAPSGGLFGAPAKTTAATGGLFGTTATTTTTAAPTMGGGFFGSVATTTTTPSLFGTAPAAATSTGSLFGKPTTTGLFSAPATATGVPTGSGLFGASAAPSTATTAVGLGGTGTLTTTGLASGSSLGVAGAAASGSPMEAEVPQVVMDLLNMLREQIKKNQELSDEYAMNSSDSCLQMEGKIEKLKGMRVKYADTLLNLKHKANELLEKMQRDVRAAEQVRRRQNEMSKNPQFGRNQAFSYLLGICAEHEDTVREFWETLRIMEERIDARLNKKDLITKQDLQKHFEHFDQAFKIICSDVYRCRVQVQDLKDSFLDYRKRTMPYTINPFEKKKPERPRRFPGETRFMGADAFPSQMTMIKIAEMAKSTSAVQPTAGTSTFGTTGSLFGSKPFGSTGFSFNPSGSSTTAPLFKPFTATTTASAPLFGSSTTSVAGAPPPAPTTASSFTFGNTLNSSVSGTLFGGSASKPFGR